MSLVLSRLDRPLPACVPSAGGALRVPVRLDLAAPEAALAPQRVAGYSDVPAHARDLAWEMREWLHAVWTEQNAPSADGRRRTLSDAVMAVRLRHPDRWPQLARCGKGGGDGRTERNARTWLAVLQNGKHTPDWNRWPKLVRSYARGPRESSVPAEFARAVLAQWLHPQQPPLAPIYRAVARLWRKDGRGGQVPSLKAMRNFIDIRVDQTVLERYRGGAKAYADRVRGWVPRELTMAPGEVWFSDHTLADLFVRHPMPDGSGRYYAVRPYVTAISDARSGMLITCLIYVDEAPNHRKILEAIQTAALAAGCLPATLYTDQGSDFTMTGFSKPLVLRAGGEPLVGTDGRPLELSCLRTLGVELHEARAYNGREKPIERRFRDVEDTWARMQEGYCGNSPSHRPDRRETWQGDVNRLMTVQQATDSFAAWHREDHCALPREQGLTVAEVWAQRTEGRPPLDTARLFFGLLVPHQPVRISRTPAGTGGVRHAGWTYSHVALKPLWGQHVVCKTYWGTPEVVRQGKSRPAAVFVFDLQDRFLCAAPADHSVSMLATDDEQRQLLGRIQHVINAAAKLDRVAYRELTGRERLPTSPAAVAAAALPEWQADDLCAVRIAQPGRQTRRIPGTHTRALPPGPDPTDTAAIEDVAAAAETVRCMCQVDQDEDWSFSDDELAEAAVSVRLSAHAHQGGQDT